MRGCAQAAWAAHSRALPLAGACACAAYLACTLCDGSLAAARARLDWSSLHSLVRRLCDRSRTRGSGYHAAG